MKEIYKCRKNYSVDEGITLIALVVTIVVLLILAGITISLVFGSNGVIKKAQEANENTKIAQVREQLELAKGPEYIEGNGKYNPDSYFERIETEGIIGNKDTDVIDNGDGTYEVTTTSGYIFKITLVPSKDNVEDIQIEHIGKVDGPRIRNLKVTNKTTNSITVEVETANAEGATYTYYYKKDGEVSWKKAEEIKEKTYTFSGLESNVIYNIKVRVEKDGKAVEKEVSTITGELPEGAVQFSPVEWKNGQASTTITTSETGYTLQYQIGEITEGSWTNTTSGSVIGNLQHGQIVYGRLFDGTNGSKTANIDVQDLEEPKVNITVGEITTNSITVSVGSSDEQWGMPTTPTYNYYIKKSTEGNYQETANYTGTNTSYTFTGLTQGTKYDVKVTTQDKAGNIGTGTLINKTTGEIGGATGGLVEGNIIASNPTWSNGTASITLSKGANVANNLTIQYQVNGINDNSWITGTNVTGLHHNDTVYARLTDGINNGDYASVSIIDKKEPNAPTISLSGTAGANGWYKSNVTVTIIAGSDEESGANKLRYNITGAQAVEQTDTATGTTSVTISTNGISTITAYTVDKAGNVSTAKTQTINRDNVEPIANITVGTKTETSIGISVIASDTISGLASNGTYKYYLNSEISPRETSTSNTYIFSGLTENTSYTLKVVVTDNAGNTVVKTITVSTNSLWAMSYSNESCTGKIIKPSSTTNPTTLIINNTDKKGINTTLRYNKPIKVGDNIEVKYKYIRSNNQYYFDFIVDGTPTYGTFGPNSGLDPGNSNKTLTFSKTVSAANNYCDFTLFKSDAPSDGYTCTLYIYDISINGNKIL